MPHGGGGGVKSWAFQRWQGHRLELSDISLFTRLLDIALPASATLGTASEDNHQ